MLTPVVHPAWAEWIIDPHLVINRKPHYGNIVRFFLSSRAMTQDQIKNMKDRVVVLRRFL